MRITSFAPSMTQPTYAVSSAPQGTFGASTPVVRSVAPTATETQRSGGLLPSRRVLGVARGAVLASTVFLAGCTDSAVTEASSFVRQLTSTFPSLTTIGSQIEREVPRVGSELASPFLRLDLPTIRDQLATEGPRVGSELASTFPRLDLPTIRDQLATEGPKALVEVASAPSEILANPVPAVVAAVLPNPIASSSVSGSSGGLCSKPEGWIALTEGELAKRAGSPLSPNAEEKAGSAFSYKDLYNIVINKYTKPVICPILDPFIPEPSLKNIEAGVTGAGQAYTRYLEEEAAREAARN